MRDTMPDVKKTFSAVAAVVAVVSISACGSDSKPAAEVSYVTVTPSPTSGITGQDETFLAQVRLIKEIDGTKSQLIDAGHAVCDGFDNGQKMEVLESLNESYGINAAASFMHAAISTYCPEHLASR